MSGVQQSTVSKPAETPRQGRSRAGTYAAIATFLVVCTVALFFLGTYKSILQEYVILKDRTPTSQYLLRDFQNRGGTLRVFCRSGIVFAPRLSGLVKFEQPSAIEVAWTCSDAGQLLIHSPSESEADKAATPGSPRELFMRAGFHGDEGQLKRMVQDFEHILNLIRDGGPYSQTYTFDTEKVAKETGLNEFVPLNPQPLFALRSNGLAEWLSPPIALGALGCLCASLWCYVKSRGNRTA